MCVCVLYCTVHTYMQRNLAVKSAHFHRVKGDLQNEWFYQREREYSFELVTLADRSNGQLCSMYVASSNAQLNQICLIRRLFQK